MSKKRFSIKATVYDKRGRVLTTGFNSYDKTHPLQAKYAIQVGLENKIYLHAELAALAKLRKHHRPYKIVVERYLEDGSKAIAKPCPICQTAIESYGIKKVEHT